MGNGNSQESGNTNDEKIAGHGKKRSLTSSYITPFLGTVFDAVGSELLSNLVIGKGLSWSPSEIKAFIDGLQEILELIRNGTAEEPSKASRSREDSPHVSVKRPRLDTESMADENTNARKSTSEEKSVEKRKEKKKIHFCTRRGGSRRDPRKQHKHR